MGRRVGSSKKREKFSIPTERKKQLFSISPDQTHVEPQEPKKGLPLIPDPLERGEDKEEEKVAGESQEENKESLLEKSVTEKEFFDRVEALRNERIRNEQEAREFAGIVFLKAAEWEMMHPALLAEILKDFVREDVDEEFEEVCDILTFLHLDDHYKDIENKQLIESRLLETLIYFSERNYFNDDFINHINQMKQKINKLNDKSILKKIEAVFQQKMHEAEAYVGGFRLECSDGSQWTIDPAFGFFGSDRRVSRVFDSKQVLVDHSGNQDFSRRSREGVLICEPLHRAMTSLAECLVANIRPMVFSNIATDKGDLHGFYEMINIFENVRGKTINKIVVFDEKMEDMASFEAIPAQKRIFSLGMSPKGKVFQELSKTAKWVAKRPFYFEEMDEILYFAETKTSLFHQKNKEIDKDFIFITVFKDKTKDPIRGILSNQENEDSKNILLQDLRQWYHFYGENEEKAQKIGHFDVNLTQETTDLELLDSNLGGGQVFSWMLNRLKSRCEARYFFGICEENKERDFLEGCYRLKGRIKKNNQSVIVELEVPSNWSYKKELQRVVYALNQQRVFDPLSRRVWVHF